jgi:hypothetical protein
MNVNVKLSLTDDQRRALASSIAGKPVKRLATRADVNELVKDLLAATMAGSAPSLPTVPDNIDEHCSFDCCRRNDLLQTRVNILQHKLDTRK